MRKISKILCFVLIALLVPILAGNIYLAVADALEPERTHTLLGFKTAVVLSGSMEPTIQIDDLIVTRAAKEYKIGDVIAFESGSSLVTHRIVGEGEDGFITRGDANNVDDLAPVAPEAIVGRVVLTLPRVGRALELIRSPLGILLLGGAAALMLLIPAKDEHR